MIVNITIYVYIDSKTNTHSRFVCKVTAVVNFVICHSIIVIKHVYLKLSGSPVSSMSMFSSFAMSMHSIV